MSRRSPLTYFSIFILLAQFFAISPSIAAVNKVSITKLAAESNGATIAWELNRNIPSAYYKVQYTNLDSKVSRAVNTKLKFLKITGLDSLTNYQVSILVYLGKKVVLKSASQKITTLDPGIQNYSITNVSHNSAQLNWLVNPQYTSYKLLIDKTKFVETKSSPYVISNLTPGIAHLVSIKGLIGSKEGVLSEELTIDLLTTGPELLAVSNVSTTGLNISWSEMLGASNYRIYRDSILLDTTKTNSYKLTSLKPGTSGLIEVSATFDSYETEKSSLKFNTLIDTPAAPTVASSTASTASVTWKTDVNATGYTVTLGDFAGTLIRNYSVAAGLTSLTISGLANLTPYTVSITNNYGSSSSKASATAPFTTAKEAPSGLTATLIRTTTFNLSWNQIPGSNGYEIYKDGLILATITDSTITSYSAVSFSPGFTHSITMRARYIDFLKISQVSDFSSSLAVTMLADPNFAPSGGTPTIILPYANVPIVGATLTSTPGVWTSVPAVSAYIYQWQKSIDGGSTYNDISGATSASYVVNESDYQFKLRLKVTATNSNGRTIAYSSGSGLVDAIYNTGVPIVRGTLVVGQILDVTQGNWSSPYPLTYSYKWYRDGSAISGETTPTYTLTASDVATSITCQVTAINRLGSLAVSSSPRSAVQAVAATVSPVVTGTTRVGSALSTTDGTWIGTPDSNTYQWQRSVDGILWDSIASETNSTYTITSSDTGQYVRALVYGNKTISAVEYRATAPSNSILVPVPAFNVSNSVAPTVSGSWTTGQTLTANNGSWSATGTFTYQWQSSTDNSTFADISGATNQTYTLTSSEDSKYVRVRVYNTTSSGDGVAYSIATSKVNAPYCTSVPVITSSLRIGNTQSVTTGTWSNTPTSYTYQWQSSTNSIAWSNADTGTDSSYIATFDVANKYIRVLVTATNATGSTTLTIGNISGFLPPVATAIPVITGTVSGTNTLTTSTGTWPSMNGQTPYEYQWQKSSDNGTTWINISGAMSSTYALVAADQGYIIRSQVSVRTNTGTSTSYSIPTAAVG